MSRTTTALALALTASLAACHRAPPPAPSHDVRAQAYDAFYIWPGVRPPDDIHPRTLYLLDGEIRRGGPPRFTRLRMGTPRLPGVELWLVVRANRLDWDAANEAAIFEDLKKWQAVGNRVAGLQVDFDSSAKGLENYRRFLADLRKRLPRPFRLSITGLMDWSAHGDPQTLAALRPIIDEVVIQTYQGRTTIPGYTRWFDQMGPFPIPFRVALAENSEWHAPTSLTRQPQFKGYIVFLLRHSTRN